MLIVLGYNNCMQMPKLVVLLANLRSLYNVGSIMRTADAAGVEAVVCCGFTPYPEVPNDPRPAYEIRRTTAAIAKTALGAEQTVTCFYFANPAEGIKHYRMQSYRIAALEQASDAKKLFTYQPKFPMVLTLGHEVDGHNQDILKLADDIIEIPMAGHKESLNVSVAAGVAMYQLLNRL